MAIQMTGGADHVVIGETDANLIPDMTWLQKQFDAQQQNESSSANEGSIKLVVIVNPGNPSGTIVPKPILEEAAAMCAKHDAWLVRLLFTCIARLVDAGQSRSGAKTIKKNGIPCSMSVRVNCGRRL